MWFVFALVATLGWGFADLFYKKSTDEDDPQSHLKIAVWVGLVMGVCSIVLIPFSETRFTAASFFTSAVKYSPASLAYIISMVVGYAGMRYLEISIISPVQNSSGALSAIAMTVFFLVTGKMASVTEEFSALDFIGTAIIVAGVIALAVVEKRIRGDKNAEKKYRFGALALLFPLVYCVFDTIGTAADGIILDEDVGLGLGEIDVLVLYGLTFLAAGIVCWVYMLIRNGKPYNPLRDPNMAAAAVFEEFGQVFYVYAMARNPVLSAPMVACYCIVSVLLGNIVLNEKLKPAQYVCVITVIAGIALLGVSEGLSEL